MAFIDLGDQFIALRKGTQVSRDGRHFGLVVDDKQAARAPFKQPASPQWMAVSSTSATPGEIARDRRLENVQFTKAPNVLRGMGLDHLMKNASAKKELAKKGMTVE